jgi:hypothetical protein
LEDLLEQQRRVKGAALEAGQLKRHPEDEWKLIDPWRLSGYARQSFRHLIRLFCPSNGPKLDEDMIDRIEQGAMRVVASMQPLMSRGFGLLPVVLELAPLWLLKEVRPLHQLEREQATEIIEQIAHSNFMPFRSLIFAMRAVIFLAYFDQDEVHAAIGYDPISFMKQRIALRRRLLDGSTPTPDDMLPDLWQQKGV